MINKKNHVYVRDGVIKKIKSTKTKDVELCKKILKSIALLERISFSNILRRRNITELDADKKIYLYAITHNYSLVFQYYKESIFVIDIVAISQTGVSSTLLKKKINIPAKK